MKHMQIKFFKIIYVGRNMPEKTSIINTPLIALESATDKYPSLFLIKQGFK